MTTPSILGERELGLAREAAEWRVLSLLFECPTSGWAEQLGAIMANVEDVELRSAGEAALREASQGQYHHAFGPGGPAPPREATYHQSVELGHLLSEIEIYYDAFAFSPQTPEPPDHVAVESNFIAYLRFKESYAVARGEDEQAASCAEAARSFIRNHLAKVAQPLAASLAESGIGHLAQASAALLRRVGASAAVESVAPQAPTGHGARHDLPR